MQSQKRLKKQFVELSALKGLTQTYEEVALTKMQEIRQAVLETREFLSGVEEIHSLARAAYLSEVLLITNKKKRQKEIDFIHKNRKTVTVFISGNHSLLGSIVFTSYKVFLELGRKMDSDKVILGDIGRYLASGERPSFDFSYFPFEDFIISDEQIKPVVDFISKYERVFVVYPRFDSVLVQVPQIDELTGGVSVEQSISGKKRYFFEPSPKGVMAYFDEQIIGTLFRQKMLEAMLAKHSSRLTIMDSATQTLTRLLQKNTRDIVMATRRASNKKMLESFAGMTLWMKD